MVQNWTESDVGKVGLWMAANEGNEIIVKLLLERGIKLDCRDEHGCTALSWAICDQRSSVARLLLERGACLTARTIWVVPHS